MAETSGSAAAGGAARITLDLSEFSLTLMTLKGRIDSLQQTIEAVPPPEAPAGSPAIVSFVKALNEVITVAKSINSLFATDAESFESVYNAKVEQDNSLSSGIGITK